MIFHTTIDRAHRRMGRWRALTMIGAVGLVACGSPSAGSGQLSNADPMNMTNAPAVGTALTCTNGKTRVYYIAADEVAWDYAPSGKNLITGQPFDDVANVFVQAGPDRVGHVYMKSL